MTQLDIATPIQEPRANEIPPGAGDGSGGTDRVLAGESDRSRGRLRSVAAGHARAAGHRADDGRAGGSGDGAAGLRLPPPRWRPSHRR